MQSRKISEFMTPMPKTIGHDMTTDKAMAMMHEMNCHHLPVLDGGKLVGVLSQRDLRVVESIEKDSKSVVVEDLMAEEPVIVDPESTLQNTLNMLLDKKIGSVIVAAKADQPWGIFTTTDALKILVKN